MENCYRATVELLDMKDRGYLDSKQRDENEWQRSMNTRQLQPADMGAAAEIWNEVIRDGNAFAEEECLTPEEASTLFSTQSYVGIAQDANREIVGAYILHPNYPGRLGGICNASFAVRKSHRGKHIGEKLVEDCIEKAKTIGFRIIQFNAVIESNTHARHLYERLGFIQSGTIPDGFRLKDGSYENICQYYLKL